MHDAANDEGADTSRPDSEKAPSESSVGGKEKHPKQTKPVVTNVYIYQDITYEFLLFI